ncbi:MAG: chorismate lyase [Methylococcaceae bacterium]
MAIKSFLFHNEPKWLENRLGSRYFLPKNVQSWVYEAGSLTSRLRSFYSHRVAVNILFQQRCKPFLSEFRLLNLPDFSHQLVREVLLHADGKPLILARTIIPEQTINAARRSLSRLDERPLGEVIFSYPNLQRQQLDISLIQPKQWTQNARAIAHIGHALWARRTVYSIAQGQPLLVSEFFLPAALAIA